MSIFMRLAFIAIVVLVHIFIYFVLFKNISASPLIKGMAKCLVLANFLCLLIFFKLYHDGQIGATTYDVLSCSVGILWICFVVALLVWGLSWGIRLGFGALTLEKWQGTMLLNAWILIFILFLMGIMTNSNKALIVKQTIELPGLTRPINIAQLSDIHITVSMNKKEVAELVEQTNSLNPDLVVLTGDIVDSPSIVANQAIQELANLKSKYGVYYVLGNHEYYYDTDKILKSLKMAGITTLVNQSMILKNLRLNISGLADLAGDRPFFKNKGLEPNIEDALKANQADFPTILLAHQPKVIDKLKDEKVDLIISGHTHGGQIFPFNFLVKLDQPFVSGLHEFFYANKSKKVQIYISKGAGWWGPPLRLFDGREINFLQLVASKSA